MNKFIIAGSFMLTGFVATAQKNLDKIINVAEVERIERVLAADDMKGRKTFSPEIDKAADFIAAEFKKAGLQYFNGLTSYKQSFNMAKAKQVSASAEIDGKVLPVDDFVAITKQANLKFNEKSVFKIVVIDSAAKSFSKVGALLDAKENTLVLVDPAHAKNLARLKRIGGREGFTGKPSVVFALTTNTAPAKYSFDIVNEITSSNLANVIGILPGKSKKEELVIFSGHYDHIGIGKPTAEGDSIYNGANDDAAGTTAVMMLANYFAKEKNNERTLVFVAFTAEEIGGFGSQYFSQQIDADKTIAMFNIEMIGTESKWGKNSAFITGYEKSDFGKILQGNLTGSQFKFEPDPYPKQNLFYRSDNATLAALGVPAHTISTSKMDTEKYYHTADDEIETLDMANMTEIIKAIAISSKGIVSGKETPIRVEKIK
ncbi:MAG: M28 family peptidase [Sphingobacteriales bacterium]|nr:MAG: M28 family peptidase [Sphingobacteriales bacterium]